MSRERKDSSAPSDDLLRAVTDAVRSLQFGHVQITVHDARIVRIEKTERIRVSPAGEQDGGRGGEHL